MDQEPAEAGALAARALLAFWRAAGVDMEEAEAVFAGAPLRAPAPAAPSAAPKRTRAPGQKTPVDAARALAERANSVAELRAAVEKYEGCGLKSTARTTVFADGVENARVLLIGEAPGKEEDEQGKPFVGRSGQLLDRMLASIGLDRRKNLFISNAIYWRPPGDRNPTQGEIAACLPFAERLIALTKPEILILVGGSAAQIMLRRDEGVTRLRGRKLVYQAEAAPPVNTLVMLHPAYLMRRPQEKRAAWNDLLLLEAWLEELGVARAATL